MDVTPPTVDERAASPGVDPPRIVISLLGGFRVTVDGHEVAYAVWKRRKARSLVKLLALAPRQTLHREELIDRLWPDLDGDMASGSLRLHLHLARRAFRSSGDKSIEVIQLQDERLRLRGPTPRTIEIDVQQFTSAAAAAQRSGDAAALQSAIDLYAGDLLPEDRYEDWAAAPRETLRETYLNLLIALAQLHESRGRHDAAIAAFERVVSVDATHEDAHAGLMRVYARLGRTGQALRQYTRLREALGRELEVEPSATTQRLHADIAAGRFPAPHDPSQERAENVDDPPVSAPRQNHNLPAPLTSFVGRQREIVEVQRLFTTTRLLTLTGAGGSGKTRLALEVAGQLVDDFDDGVWLVQLASRTDPALVPAAVAAAAGVHEQPGRSMVDLLVDAFRARSLVLVLDNCEHLIEACASLVETLLAACPRLRILATSREALRVPGEIAWQVPPLTLPSAALDAAVSGQPAIDRLAQVEAVALFIDRVRWVRPDFVLTGKDADAVVQICQRLDGLPLALELAAARASVLSLAQLAGRLDDALSVLSAGSRTAPTRQKTLQATLDWSYALLDEQERTLLRRLSVFAGGWTIEAAECVSAGMSANGQAIEGDQILDLLSNLVAKSLVLVDDGTIAGSGAPGIRYRLLETVRQYAAARLADSGEAAWAGERHAVYVLSLLTEAEPALRGVSPRGAWLDRLEGEHDNLRAALRWSVEREDVALEARLCSILWRFWYFQGYFVEGDRWLSGVLARLDTRGVDSLVRAKVLQGAAALASNQGDPTRAELLSRQALPLFEEAGDTYGLSVTLHALGVVAELQGDYDEARYRYQEVLRLREQLGDAIGAATSLYSLANLDREQGDLARAADHYEQSIALQRRNGNTRGVALALAGLAVVALDQGDYSLSAALSTQAIELWNGLGARARTINALNNLGYALMYQGDTRQGLAREADCLRLAIDAGDQRGIAYGLEGVASAIALHDPSMQDAERAARLFGAAEALRDEIQVPLPPADRALNDRPMAVARRTLGEAAFQTAWRQGRTLPVEEAIAEAFAARDAPATGVHAPVPVREPVPLSRREREVAQLVAQGHTNREIAAELGMANRTVDTHVSNLLRKLRLASRADVAAWATEHGLLPEDPSSP